MIPAAQAERSWLARHEIRPRKRLGQNFLIQPQVADRLLRALPVALEPGRPVLEVGAGAGALTRALLETGVEVWAVEIDPRLVDLLRERFADAVAGGRLHLLPGSVLDQDPRTIPGRAPAEPFTLLGNLPYAITTPILLWMLEHRRVFSRASVLVQRELAERITASPGTRAYGSLTVWIAYHAEVRSLVTVGPKSFWPVPAVHSSWIEIDFRTAPPVHVRDPELLERVLAAAFGQRRKMLRASLASALGGREIVLGLLEHAGIDPTRRAETLTLAEFAALANTLGEAL
jgi:16S rRNA (adenine1518-N6/adenine1519-N6)-dimethyltransferase